MTYQASHRRDSGVYTVHGIYTMRKLSSSVTQQAKMRGMYNERCAWLDHVARKRVQINAIE